MAENFDQAASKLLITDSGLDNDTQNHYQQITDFILYTNTQMRPDLTTALLKLCQFNAKASKLHLTATECLLHYAHSILDYSITYSRQPDSNNSLTIYSDANYANDLTTRCSTSGFVAFYNGGLIAWSSRKQDCVTLSSTEADYVALTHAGKEAVWLHNLLKSIGASDTAVPIYIHGDNLGSIALFKGSKHHQHTKHINV